MKVLHKILTITAALAAMSCTDLTIYDEMGTQPDVAAMGTPVLSLRAEQAPDNVVSLTFTEGGDITSMTREVMIKSNVPMETNLLVDLTVDETALKAYEEENGLEAGTLKLLPVAFYRFSEGNSAEINKGDNTGKPNILTVYSVTPLGAELAPGRYLLPLKGESVGNELTDNSIMIDVTVRQPYTDPDGYDMYEKDDLFTVFYINTSVYDPRLATDMILITDMSSSAPQFGIGNIVNLRTSSVGYDSVTGKVSVVPSNDLRYILDHYTERVRPVQESGRKVCVCIEGGGKGVGFCNFNDAQIDEFVASAKRMVDTYGLDGINLWDRNSGYDKSVESGFPEMNTTSYPKFIKALREALGPDKLLTVVDYEEPTEYFHDVTATEGIEVGKYIDYAWSGYCDESEPLQIVDPWTQFDDGRPEDDPYKVTKYKHRPIAGMSAENYGCIMATRYDAKSQPDRIGIPTIEKWVADGNSKSNISVFYDLASITQDKYEGGLYVYPDYLCKILTKNDNLQLNIKRLQNIITGTIKNQYNKWAKDW